MKGLILRLQGRTEEAVPEDERALALDPSNVHAVVDLGFDYGDFGQFDKGLEYFDKAILLSPHDPAITVNQTGGVQYIHAAFIAALALSGHDAEAREALQRYLALPSSGPLKTIAAWKTHPSEQSTYPRFIEMNERTLDGLRKAGMPEELAAAIRAKAASRRGRGLPIR